MSLSTGVTTSVAATDSVPVNPSAMSPAAPVTPKAADRGWVLQITALSIILGVMLALALNTTNRIREAGVPASRLGVNGAVLQAYNQANQRLEDRVKALQNDLRQYEQAVGKESEASAKLRQEVEEARYLAGLTPVKGPGLIITLRDSTVPKLPDLSREEYEGYLIHDRDIYGILNELKAAGVEAVAITGADRKNIQRVVATTAIRCVGPSALVNNVPLAAPYSIMAIGSGKDMQSALEMPNGVVEERALKPLKMIQFEEASELVLPAYSGGRGAQYARPATTNP